MGVGGRGRGEVGRRKGQKKTGLREAVVAWPGPTLNLLQDPSTLRELGGAFSTIARGPDWLPPLVFVSLHLSAHLSRTWASSFCAV